ncbi:MAG: scpB [Sphingomonadales bacterium]|nr:scpB [Sphingomonadales bacterium]
MTDELRRAVEALLFASESPLSIPDIEQRLGVTAGVPKAIEALVARHAGQGINLVGRGGRWHFQTAADLAHLLRETRESSRRLSRAGTETLAIIAYHEPVSRAEIEAIRGV